MIQQQKIPVYIEITLDIQEKINNGFYSKEGLLPSRKELCQKYNISAMTAFKVHNELEKNGFAYKVRGKGVFVSSNCPRAAKKQPLTVNPVKKIVYFAYEHTQSTPGLFEHKMFSGLQRRAFEAGLNIRTELFSASSQGSKQILDDEGLVMPYNGHCEWVFPMMERKRVRTVMLNNFFSEAYCVLNDNYSGISQLIDFLESQGCSKLILATKHFDELGIANLCERKYAFQNECRKRNLDHQLLENGNYNELMSLVKKRSTKPDAILFTSDGPALKFKDMMQEEKIKKQPIITGFDGWHPETGMPREDLTTILIDYEAMGALAVDLMLNNSYEDWHLPDTVRTPCKLIVNI